MKIRAVFLSILLGLTFSLNFLEHPYVIDFESNAGSSGNNSTNLNGITLGSGYIAHADTFSRSECFNYEISYGAGQAEIKFDSSSSNKEIRDSLKINTDGQLGIQAIIDLKAELKLEKDFEEDIVTIRAKYFSKISRIIKYKVIPGFDAGLTDYGKSVFKRNPKEFASVCGDRHISYYEEGAFLLATIEFQFTNSDDKKMIEPLFKNAKIASFLDINFEMKKLTEKKIGNLEAIPFHFQKF